MVLVIYVGRVSWKIVHFSGSKGMTGGRLGESKAERVVTYFMDGPLVTLKDYKISKYLKLELVYLANRNYHLKA